MSLKIRRIIYGLFIALFLLLAPAVIFYASGYRYNFKKNKLQETGALFLETLPKGAAISLENQLTGRQTNSQINNLLAGEYPVKLTLDGYHDWQKKLPVYPETVTFAKAVVLFKNNAAIEQLIGEAVLNAWPDHGGQKIIALTDQRELWLADLSRQTAEPLALSYQVANNFELISWSPSDKKILAQDQNGYLVVNAEKPEEIVFLADISTLNFQAVKWDGENDNLLYARAGSTIYKINLASQEARAVNAKTNGDFFAINDDFYYFLDGYLTRQTTGQAKPQEIVKLPDLGNYVFLSDFINPLAIIDRENQNFLLINPDSGEIVMSDKAKAAAWSASQTGLLYYNDFEIWIWRPAGNSKELIARYSRPVKEVIWYPSADYLIFTQENENRQIDLIITELDSRDYRQTILLLTADKIADIVLNPKGDDLFFTAQIGQQTGLYSLNIH